MSTLRQLLCLKHTLKMLQPDFMRHLHVSEHNSEEKCMYSMHSAMGAVAGISLNC